MMKCKRVFAVVGLFAALFFCGGTLSAVETEDVNSQVLERPILDQMGEKLGRGGLGGRSGNPSRLRNRRSKTRFRIRKFSRYGQGGR